MTETKTPPHHIVEIRRTVTYVEWAQFVVYADTPEAAHALAQAEAERLNGASLHSIDTQRDDGDPDEWEAASVDYCAAKATYLPALGPEPADA